jgi:hypothetical protein
LPCWAGRLESRFELPATSCGVRLGRIAYQAGVPLPTIQRIFGHVSINQALHYVGVGQAEMTEGFAVFDTHIRTGMDPQRQRAF